MGDLQFHPLANIFPLMEDDDLLELAGSIRDSGLREPVIIYEGAILDGRNRYRACELADVNPTLTQFTGDDAAKFVIDKNLRRRHLTPSQRGMIAAKLSTLKDGQKQQDKEATGIPIPQAAAMLGVNKDTVSNAKIVLSEGSEEEIKAVEEGKAAVSTTADNIRKRTPKIEAKKNLSDKGKNVERIQNARIKAEIWGHIRDALVHLTSLPQVQDAVRAARASDKNGLVDKRLARSIKYLREFENAWNNQGADYNGNAGAGNSASGVEQAESAA